MVLKLEAANVFEVHHVSRIGHFEVVERQVFVTRYFSFLGLWDQATIILILLFVLWLFDNESGMKSLLVEIRLVRHGLRLQANKRRHVDIFESFVLIDNESSKHVL